MTLSLVIATFVTRLHPDLKNRIGTGWHKNDPVYTNFKIGIGHWYSIDIFIKWILYLKITHFFLA